MGPNSKLALACLVALSAGSFISTMVMEFTAADTHHKKTVSHKALHPGALHPGVVELPSDEVQVTPPMFRGHWQRRLRKTPPKRHPERWAMAVIPPLVFLFIVKVLQYITELMLDAHYKFPVNERKVAKDKALAEVSGLVDEAFAVVNATTSPATTNTSAKALPLVSSLPKVGAVFNRSGNAPPTTNTTKPTPLHDALAQHGVAPPVTDAQELARCEFASTVQALCLGEDEDVNVDEDDVAGEDEQAPCEEVEAAPPVDERSSGTDATEGLPAKMKEEVTVQKLQGVAALKEKHAALKEKAAALKEKHAALCAQKDKGQASAAKSEQA